MCIEDLILSRIAGGTPARNVIVGANAVNIAFANPKRVFIGVSGGSAGAVWIGNDPGVVANRGIQIAVNGGLGVNFGYVNQPGMPQKDWWAIRATVDVTITVFESFIDDDYVELQRLIARIKSSREI